MAASPPYPTSPPTRRTAMCRSPPALVTCSFWRRRQWFQAWRKTAWGPCRPWASMTKRSVRSLPVTASTVAERSAAARLLHGLDRSIAAVATLRLSGLILILLANVTGRYLLGTSLVWAQEAAIWLFIYIIFLGLPLALRARQHIALTLLRDRLPPAWRPALAILIDGIVAYVTLMLLIAGLELMQRIGGTSPALLLPVWLKFVFIPLSCLASLLCIALAGFERGIARWQGPLSLLLGALLYLLLHQLEAVSL